MLHCQTKWIALLPAITLVFGISCRTAPPEAPVQESDHSIVASARFLPTGKTNDDYGYYEYKVKRLKPPVDEMNHRVVVSDEKGNTVYDQGFTVLLSVEVVQIENGSEQLAIIFHDYSSVRYLRILTFSGGTPKILADDLPIYGRVAFVPDQDAQLAAQSSPLILDLGRAKSDFGTDFSVRMYRLEDGEYRYVRAVGYKRILKELREGPKSKSVLDLTAIPEKAPF